MNIFSNLVRMLIIEINIYRHTQSICEKFPNVSRYTTKCCVFSRDITDWFLIVFTFGLKQCMWCNLLTYLMMSPNCFNPMVNITLIKIIFEQVWNHWGRNWCNGFALRTVDPTLEITLVYMPLLHVYGYIWSFFSLIYKKERDLSVIHTLVKLSVTNIASFLL